MANPQDWIVLTNDGTTITAKHRETGASFSGTVAQYNTMLAQDTMDVGEKFDPSLCAQTLVYSGNDLSYIDADVNGAIYRQTFSYSDGKLVGISKWVKQ